MIDNPFTSKIYELTWLKYFTKYKQGKTFSFINGLRFYKHRFLPYYINVGRNFTNGMTYNLDHEAKDYNKKTVLIYDVPSYFKIEPPKEDSPIKLYSIDQYKGYLADLNQTNTLDDYLSEKLNNKSRNKFKSKLRKFETCFDVKYTIYHDFISKEDYEKIINEFKIVIIKRFETLKLDTNLIKEWSFYYELIYKMIIDKKALLISITANNKPVAMSLSFMGNNTLLGAIKAFDSDYYRFNVGHIEISKLIDFCLKNNLKYFDFSKGAYEYKSKWTNHEYQYSCHILYDSSNFISCTTAKLIAAFFNFKQYLRDKNFNLFLVKFKFKLKNWKASSTAQALFKVKPLESSEDYNNLPIVNLDEESLNYSFLNRIIYDGLYQKPEPFENLKIYKSETNKKTYYVVGTKSEYAIEII